MVPIGALGRSTGWKGWGEGARAGVRPPLPSASLNDGVRGQ